MRYKIRVNQSYYGKLDGGDILYVYAICEDFEVGKQFLMFLGLNKQALYPHPIASSDVKNRHSSPGKIAIRAKTQ